MVRIRPWFALLLLLFIASFAEAGPKYVIVSDIDDTIQKTQVLWRDNPLATAKNYLTFHDAFIGMPTLYNALASRGIEFHYVTAMPQILSRLPDRFLQTSGFPVGKLWGRKSLFESTLEFKVRKITELMLEFPDRKFILIGDNGQHDVEAYHRLQKHPDLGSRVVAVFIHQLYDFTKGTPLADGQRPFISTAEITLDFREAGFLSDQEAKIILEQVERGLTSRFRNIEKLTIPEFATYSRESVEALIQRALRDPHTEIRSLLLSIADAMNERLPGHERLDSLPTLLRNTPALCHRIL